MVMQVRHRCQEIVCRHSGCAAECCHERYCKTQRNYFIDTQAETIDEAFANRPGTIGLRLFSGNDRRAEPAIRWLFRLGAGAGRDAKTGVVPLPGPDRNEAA